MPNYPKRLKLLRNWMKDRHLDAFLLISSDPHQNEYLPGYWNFNQWLTGFSGSNSTLIITENHAGLWTDSRYFIQADEELENSEFDNHRSDRPNFLKVTDWLKIKLNTGSRIGLSPQLYTQNKLCQIENELSREGLKIELLYDPYRDCWPDRPVMKSGKIIILDTKYCGLPAKEKITELQGKIINENAHWALFNSLDEIAWLLNLRGSDIPYNPLFYSNLLIGKTSGVLFIDSKKLSPGVNRYLDSLNLEIVPYANTTRILENIKRSEKILLDPDKCNAFLYRSIDAKRIKNWYSPVQLSKAVKNSTEITNLELTHRLDGAALVNAFYWLENNLGKYRITESDLAERILFERSKFPEFIGPSFESIVAYGANAAIVHYRPIRGRDSEIKKGNILLVDSGGHYLTGTTDITRTISPGTPTEEQIRNYTLVLKGHITLDSVHFPLGTNGLQLDALARQFLWQNGLDYGHGTGHGVGFYLPVHEGPQSYSSSSGPGSLSCLKENMLISNEPGFYREREYGIRIENILLIEASEHTGFLKHRHLSLFPIDIGLIQKSLLSTNEILWLNNYHTKVFQELQAYLESPVKNWLSTKCRPL